MTTAPKRRWFKFSLRTLFVAVTVLGMWIGYYIHWKQERREARLWLGVHGGMGLYGWHKVEPRPPLPWMLKLLGEESEEEIHITHNASANRGERPPIEYDQLVDRLAKLFPEAQVVDGSGNVEWEDSDGTVHVEAHPRP